MKRPNSATWVLLLVFFCGACAAPVETTSEPFTMPAGSTPASERSFSALIASVDSPGLTFHTLSENETDKILVVEIDPHSFAPRIIAAPYDGISAQDIMEGDDLTILLGSGYAAHATSLEPVGLLKVAGHELSPLEPYGYTRILGFNDDKISIVHRANYQTETFTDALQLGPGIIENRVLDISEKDLERPQYFRSFTALCDNRWLVGVSLEPTHLRTLGTSLLAFFEGQDWRCDEVVNFAGDRQAVLAIKPTDALIYHGEVTTKKVSYLGFSRRQ